ncbi:MAG: Zn-ribbon domain-containing OB-fold protein [Pseudomonadota bacterium]|nr:Zn-ribbon domain-containing OB-fold protein [Pseudomonadota bacterium]
MAAAQERAVPTPTPETAFYWQGLTERRIMIRRCTACEKAHFPPRTFCPHCGNDSVEEVEASGEATLYSFVISNHRLPDFERPYIVGIAELAEGPRMMAQIVGIEPDPAKLQVDMALEPVFHDLPDGGTLLHFRPKG